jgi:NADPH:quinone reductase-like Zn-dependent oxidoreductase
VSDDTAVALVVPAQGAAPEVREVPLAEPGPGQSVVRMLAAGLNPVDLAIAAGRFYLPVPPPPYVAGAEAVGEVERSSTHSPGTRVWVLTPTGCFAERFVVDDDLLVPVPDGPDDVTAAAVGIAGLAGWMSVRWRGDLAAGEVVLVLGAGSVVGQVAIQAAAPTAGRIVAAARDAGALERVRTLGATAVVTLGGPDDAAALRDACAPGADLVVDILWGEPLLAAIGSLAPGARIVQTGSAAAPTATLAAGPLRGRRVDLRGFSLFSEPREHLAAAYPELAAAAGRGEVRVDVETVPLAECPGAWSRQAAGAAGRKLVLVPG